MSVLKNWDKWKEFLGERLDAVSENGIVGSALSEMAFRLGNYLANEVDPQNKEEQLLADLWKCANEDEQHAIANVMLKYVRQNESH